jgi:hypothetical protein
MLSDRVGEVAGRDKEVGRVRRDVEEGRKRVVEEVGRLVRGDGAKAVNSEQGSVPGGVGFGDSPKGESDEDDDMEEV